MDIATHIGVSMIDYFMSEIDTAIWMMFVRVDRRSSGNRSVSKFMQHFAVYEIR
jgi:hypothetical protein